MEHPRTPGAGIGALNSLAGGSGSVAQVDLDLLDLIDDPRWVAWRTESRGGAPTKVPYHSVQRKAASDNPSTWRRHDEAVLVAEAIDNGERGGVGIVLGECGGHWVAGIDLDSCRDPANGSIEPWAEQVIERIASYTEVSPSEAGVKIFFLIDPADISELRAIMRTPHGRQWKRANGVAHPPAIELHVDNRYFAVTWEGLEDSSIELRTVPLHDLRWLIEQAGPTFAGKTTGANSVESYTGTNDDGVHDHPMILARLNAVARNNKSIQTAILNAATLHGGSRSEGGMGLGGALKRAGWSYEEMKAALLACPATREWAQGNVFESERQFRRIWERAEGGDGTSQSHEGWEPQLLGSDIPQPVTLEQFMTAAKPPEFLIEPILQRGFLYTCTALTGHGKSSVFIYMTLTVAANLQFAGKHTEHGRVVYLAGENPDEIAHKFIASVDYRKLDPASLPVTIVPGAFDLGGNIDKAIADVLKAADGEPIALIAIDTSAAYRFDEDEDDNQSSKVWAQNLRRFTQLPGSPAVIVATHPTKSADKDGLVPRGGGAFLNEVDGNLTLWADLDAMTTTLHWQGKLRGPGFQQIDFQLHRHSHPTWRHRDNRPVEMVVVVPSGEGSIAGTGKAKRPLGKIKPMYVRWHDALLNALVISPTPRLTTMQEWFNQCVQIGLTEHVQPDDTRQERERKRGPFRDAKSKLVAAGWVGVNGDRVVSLNVGTPEDL